MRDLHTVYSFPVPYSCWRIVLPLRFTRVYANNSFLYVVSKKYDNYTSKFGDSWLGQISVGDVLSSVDGLPVNVWEEQNVNVFGGSNQEGGFARVIEGLSFRYAYKLKRNKTLV